MNVQGASTMVSSFWMMRLETVDFGGSRDRE